VASIIGVDTVKGADVLSYKIICKQPVDLDELYPVVLWIKLQSF